MAPRPKPERKRQRHFFREWREMRFPNQVAAEEALGWSQSKVSRLESGATPYNQDDLEHAAEIFGCSPADLISRAPDQEPRDPETQLRSALLSFGVDASQLARVTTIIKTFVAAPEARPEQSQPDDQSQPASRRREPVPSR
ncbi:helix-turn-helix transcriptional regulator [Mesorhizobium sp. B1-1-4]|nr:helix-turn-helix transcriptional regulator [Mesorhizobium sp. B1-1-4]